jgi:hypothetical protein
MFREEADLLRKSKIIRTWRKRASELYERFHAQSYWQTFNIINTGAADKLEKVKEWHP